MDNFEIRIINQEWLETEHTENDLCSHGELELIIGNEKISTELDGGWTISTSVLQFLRCLEPNSETEKDFNPIMCCGGLLMMSCPIGIYFDLHHTDNETIIIKNIIKQLDTGTKFIEYPNLTVELDKKDFAVKILKIAKEVKMFFENEPKKYIELKNEPNSDFFQMEKENWIEFWKEFNELYENGINKYNC